MIRTALVVSLMAVGAAGAASASELRVTAQGENFQVDHGPGAPDNVAGGGRVEVAGGGQNLRITYLDPPPAPRRDLLPVAVAQGETFEVAWVPAAAPSPAMLAAAGPRPGEAARR